MKKPIPEKNPLQKKSYQADNFRPNPPHFNQAPKRIPVTQHRGG